MEQFIGKSILVQDADAPNSPVRRMLVVAQVNSDTYQIADFGVVERDSTQTTSQELRGWMNRNGLTQKGLADALGVHQATVSYWLSGKRGIPNRIRKMMNISDTGLESKGDRLRGLQSIEEHLQSALEGVRGLRDAEGGGEE